MSFDVVHSVRTNERRLSKTPCEKEEGKTLMLISRNLIHVKTLKMKFEL